MGGHSNLYNLPEFNPSFIIMDCHSDCYHHIGITYQAIKSYIPSTSKRIKDQLSGYCTGQMCVITKLEASGQGVGGSSSEGIKAFEFEQFKIIPSAAFRTRTTFIHDQPYVLYLWQSVIRACWQAQ